MRLRTIFFIRRFYGLFIDRLIMFSLWLMIKWTGRTIFHYTLPTTRLWNPISEHYSGGWALLADFALGGLFGLPIVEWFVILALLVTASCGLRSATPGMQVAGLLLTTCNGRPVSALRALLRHLMSYLSAVPLGLGYWWSLFDARGRTWHDIASGVVVKDASASD